ncbi:MAG: hypothetical protein AVW06_04690 [Hadesarchaea archaeon DG-33-1]|nr:MAG: hypothetical protein AVW06_04690 [Hadesarchaea archaeon DG-33-1]
MVCRDLLMRTRVSDVMLPCSTFVKPSDLMTRARSVMRTSGLRTLPVLDDDGRLRGIITARQLLRITSTRSNITVSGLMFPPRLISTPSDNLLKLAKNMIEFETSLVPVTKGLGDQNVMGVVRLEDVLRHVAKSLKPSRLTVGDIMTEEVVSCSPEDGISRVWDLMEETRYSGLPVTRYNRPKHAIEVIGMITRSDIIRYGAIRLAEESDKGRFRSSPRVHSLMRTPAITAPPTTPLSEAVNLMLKRNIGRLPVVERGKLMGLVSRADVVEACIR